ncbi:MAG TPA: DUF1028 domain-containing protein [candidate division Zixibacteria bacterium]|jgi:uncharacterized Ntn-hydrolase superfamily protein
MTNRHFLGLVVAVLALLVSAEVHADTVRPVSTYSIVARDSATGQMGVAVQSHWFSVGPIVPWAEAGVGAVATQSLVRIDYGPDGLDHLRAGESAALALTAMLAADSGREVRQVAIVDANGNVAVHTGKRCIAYAGHITGRGFSVQANLMADSIVPTAMAQAYRTATGSLAERMLAALEAAEAVGGDIRGRQSAAILVVDGKRHPQRWQGKLIELRVEDHPTPLVELRRLYDLQLAYDWMNRGDVYAEHSQWDSAAIAYGSAEKLAPQIAEIPFWHAVTLTAAGRIEDALPVFRRIFASESRWVELLPRLIPAGLLPVDSTALERILKTAGE